MGTCNSGWLRHPRGPLCVNWKPTATAEPTRASIETSLRDGTWAFDPERVGRIRVFNPAANAYSIQWRYTGIAFQFGYGKPFNSAMGQQNSNAYSGNMLGSLQHNFGGAASGSFGNPNAMDIIRWSRVGLPFCS